jgi:hypothetical protein
MPDDPRYEVEDESIKAVLRLIAERLAVGTAAINKERPGRPQIGFALFLFEFDPGDAMFWISNAQRPDMQRAMREFLRREGGQ